MFKKRNQLLEKALYLVPLGLLVTAISPVIQWWWFLDLLTHFRLQYILIGLLSLPIYFWLKRYYLALIITLVIAIHAASIWPYLHASQAHADTTAKSELSIMFANTYYKSSDFELLTNSINQAEPDILLLAEVQPILFTYLSEYYKTDYPFQEYAEGEGAYDMAVFSRTTPDLYRTIYFTPVNPSMYVMYSINDQPLHVLSIHPHSPINGEYTKLRNIDLQQSFAYADSLDGAVVVLGDFNSTQFSPFYKQLLDKSRLEDTQLEFGLQPSWHEKLPKLLRIPIDHVLVSPEVEVVSRKLGEPTGSDHLPVIVQLDLSE